jgi:hypothetical protein
MRLDILVRNGALGIALAGLMVTGASAQNRSNKGGQATGNVGDERAAGKPCPTSSGNASYSRISDPEMKQIMKNAVDRVYSMLWLEENEPTAYAARLEFGRLNSRSWDDPIFKLP